MSDVVPIFDLPGPSGVVDLVQKHSLLVVSLEHRSPQTYRWCFDLASLLWEKATAWETRDATDYFKAKRYFLWKYDNLLLFFRGSPSIREMFEADPEGTLDMVDAVYFQPEPKV